MYDETIRFADVCSHNKVIDYYLVIQAFIQAGSCLYAQHVSHPPGTSLATHPLLVIRIDCRYNTVKFITFVCIINLCGAELFFD